MKWIKVGASKHVNVSLIKCIKDDALISDKIVNFAKIISLKNV